MFFTWTVIYVASSRVGFEKCLQTLLAVMGKTTNVVYKKFCVELSS
jgi:hypothetical protein